MACGARKRYVWLATILAAASLAGSTAAAPFSSLVVFGDSLSDIGNIAQAPFINTPGPYYWNGRFSNGPVYAETLDTGLGLPALTRSTALGGTDYAYGGAQTTGTGFPDNLFVQDVDDQVNNYLSSKTPDATTLYVVFAGANDLLGGQTNMSVPVNSLQSSINKLITHNARKFLIFNLPPLGNTPRFNGSQLTLTQYNTRSQQYNAALSTMLNGLATNNPSATFYQFDVTALFNRTLANPQAFGLTNVTSSAAPGLSPGDTSYNTSLIVPNPNQYMFWDDLHPTQTVHAILAQRALDLFRLPGDFNQDNVVNGADYILWRKGQSPSHIPDDYNVWRAHDGQTAGSGSGAAGYAGTVPEPASILILLPAAFAAATASLVHRGSRCSRDSA
jgi:phospholipase/lecithinase/hemolysin